ncbi:MAG: DUF2442 domain-containing protein [Magnetococcales bacterium]|nr:DUF2442 domain-containing protein [Magnetococcales bacterium]
MPLPRIVSVAPGERPYTLHIGWKAGGESLVDVSTLIETFRVYTPLRQSIELFKQVRIGEYGTDIVWTEEVDLSAETLWRLAQEQSQITVETFQKGNVLREQQSSHNKVAVFL